MADSALIQRLQMEQTAAYLAAAGAALVAYDQVLTFSQEANISDNCSIPQFLIILSWQVNLVWNRQWSFMTALYIIARYIGSLFVIGYAAMYICISWTYSGYVNMLLTANWAGNIFFLTMQVMLVIRVYALFNRSKKVLIFLATSYVLQATATFVIMGLVANKRMFDEYYASIGPAIGRVGQSVNINYSAVPFLNTLNQDITILSIVFDTILLFFALWAFVVHTLEAKTLDGGWSINVLVRILMADHLLYFVCYLIWLSISLATAYGTEVNFFDALLSDMLNIFNALVVVAGPHMVINLRTAENKTRGEGGTLQGEVSTIRFGIREPPTQSESVMEEGGEL